MELILIFGIQILTSLFRYTNHHGVHSYRVVVHLAILLALTL
uniref:Uncharacterized protein n=1 Tax=Arundo donax TaxID=35708 RepID=A0A0A9EIZ0_ARUDO